MRTRPRVDPSVFIAPGAVVVGDVTIGAESSIWFGCVLRGDRAEITIGQRCNIQDGAIIHENPNSPTRIGCDVSVGHAAVVHGATIGDRVLVGIHATVMNHAVVGDDSIVGAGAVVTEGMVIPPGSLVLGVPARVVKPMDERGRRLIRDTVAKYVELSRRYLAADPADPCAWLATSSRLDADAEDSDV